jgi:hypothetical protein
MDMVDRDARPPERSLNIMAMGASNTGERRTDMPVSARR